MFSRNAAHAIEVMGHLARNIQHKPLKLEQLSTDTGIPRHSVVKAVQALHKRRLLSTSRGSLGGILLVRPPGGIMLNEIVCAVDGPPDECPVSQGADSCLPKVECPILQHWKKLAQQVRTLQVCRDLQSFAEQDVAIDYYSC